MRKVLAATCLSALLLTVGSQAAITFTVTFTAQALIDLDAANQAKFTAAVSFWDAIIIGHQDGVARSWNLEVDTFDTPASGGGVILGSAGPATLGLTNTVPGSGLGGSWPNNFIISTSGFAEFNVNAAAGGGNLNPAVLRHEIGHALGIGTLWEDNEVYNDGVADNSNRTLVGGIPGQYTGAAALAAYQAEFNPAATFIPVERDGPPGTANGHWNERLDNIFSENVSGADSDPGDGGPAPTVLSGVNIGQSLDNELMTGLLSNPAFLSNTTIMSLYDIGYTVVVPIPEPVASTLLAFTLLVVARRRRA